MTDVQCMIVIEFRCSSLFLPYCGEVVTRNLLVMYNLEQVSLFTYSLEDILFRFMSAVVQFMEGPVLIAEWYNA